MDKKGKAPEGPAAPTFGAGSAPRSAEPSPLLRRRAGHLPSPTSRRQAPAPAAQDVGFKVAGAQAFFPKRPFPNGISPPLGPFLLGYEGRSGAPLRTTSRMVGSNPLSAAGVGPQARRRTSGSERIVLGFPRAIQGQERGKQDEGGRDGGPQRQKQKQSHRRRSGMRGQGQASESGACRQGAEEDRPRRGGERWRAPPALWSATK